MDDIAARRQHDVGRRAAILADQFEGAGLVRPVGKHPPHQPAGDDRQVLAVTRRQRQHRLAGGRGARRRRPPAGSRRSTAARWRLVSGGGRLGIEAGPDGGARLIAPPAASGTEAGGTGGGRSVNIWAGQPEPANVETSIGRQAHSASSRRPRRARIHRCRYPRESWRMLFTENAANSSLRPGRSRHGRRSLRTARSTPGSRSSHNPRLARSGPRHKPCSWLRSGRVEPVANRLVAPRRCLGAGEFDRARPERRQ